MRAAEGAASCVFDRLAPGPPAWRRPAPGPVAPPYRGGPGMRALETIGFSLGVIAFTVALLLFLMGGPNYRHH